jgi:hypothetical protein
MIYFVLQRTISCAKRFDCYVAKSSIDCSPHRSQGKASGTRAVLGLDNINVSHAPIGRSNEQQMMTVIAERKKNNQTTSRVAWLFE